MPRPAARARIPPTGPCRRPRQRMQWTSANRSCSREHSWSPRIQSPVEPPRQGISCLVSANIPHDVLTRSDADNASERVSHSLRQMLCNAGTGDQCLASGVVENHIAKPHNGRQSIPQPLVFAWTFNHGRRDRTRPDGITLVWVWSHMNIARIGLVVFDVPYVAVFIGDKARKCVEPMLSGNSCRFAPTEATDEEIKTHLDSP